jgi:hypothetical protein
MSLSIHPAFAVTAGDLKVCTQIAAADARLACYDSLAGRPGANQPAVTPAPTRAAAVTVNSPAVAADPQNFGLTLNQLHALPEDQGPQAIQAKITRIVQDQVGHVTAVLDNGQVWRFTDADTRFTPDVGAAVTIKRAALGSFLLSASHHDYRVHRLR